MPTRRVPLVVGAVAVAVLATACSSSGGTPSGSPTAPPAATPSSSVTNAPVHTAFALAVPFTAEVPTTWTQTRHPGVSVIVSSPEGPYVGVGIDPTPIAGPTIKGEAADPIPTKLTAESLAGWVAKLPYLEPATVVATTFSGLPAWRVDVRLKDSASATATCDYNTHLCVPMISLPTVTLPLGASHGGVGRVFFVQMPNGRIVGVQASGAAADNLDGLLAVTQPVLDSIKLNAT